MSPTPPVPWEKFSGDPRDPAAEALRASDADRDIAHETLAAAFGDGRLDRQELDDRTDLVNGAKTLGQLVGPLRDLAPERAIRPAGAAGSVAPVAGPTAEAVAAGESRYLAARQRALSIFLGPTAICWVIWLVISLTSGWQYPWPIWVTLGTCFPLIQVLASRGAITASGRRSVERRQRQLDQRERHLDRRVEQLQRRRDRLSGPDR